MKARDRQRKRARAASPWLVVGAVVGTIPHLHAAEPRPPALPLERRITIESSRIEAALAHVRIFTPSETIPVGAWRDQPAVAPESPQAPPVFPFAISSGPLPAAIQEFQKLTGVTVRAADDVVRNLTTDGVSGVLSAARALDTLLSGTSLSYRFADPSTVVIEIRVDAASVEVSGALPRVESAKYTAPLRETPQTIQVIPRALLDEQGAATLSDAMRNVPGITMQAGEGGGASNTTGDMFNMRGFSANNSLFVDNVRDDGLVSRDVFNLEQIEVFSGPTGSDVGRTNAAGYINLTTKSPLPDALYAGSFSLGAGEQVRATADLNQPIAFGRQGTFLGNAAVRLNALYQDGGIGGRDYVERESKSIAPSIAFGLSTPTRLSVSGQIMRQDNLADYGLPAAASPVGPLTPTSALAASAGRSGHLLRQSRLRLRQGAAGQRHAARGARLRAGDDASKPDAVQRRDARGRDHVDRQPCRVQSGHEPRHAQPPGQRAAQRDLLQPDQPDRAPCDRPDPARARAPASRSRARASSRRRSAASARARRSI